MLFLLSVALACPEVDKYPPRFSLIGWSGDGRRIAYATWTDDREARIEVWDLYESYRVGYRRVPAPVDAVCPTHVTSAWVGERMCFPGLGGAREVLETPDVVAWLATEGVAVGGVQPWTTEEIPRGFVPVDGPTTRRRVAVPDVVEWGDDAGLRAALPGAWHGLAAERLAAPGGGAVAVVVRYRSFDGAYCHIDIADRMVFVR